MKILITGGAGFIGTHLCKAIGQRGWDVCILDIKPQAAKDREYKYFQADVRNGEHIKEALDGADWIIHLAANHHDFGISREEFFSVNEDGTRTVLNAATSQGIKKVIFLSTVAVYGNLMEPTTEISPTVPVSDYGKSKLASEEVLNDWASEQADRTVIIIRPTVVFGPHNFANIYNLIRQIARRHYLQVGKGENIKSVAYVENVVAATIFLMDQNHSGVKIYNYADEPHLQTCEIVKIISKQIGISPPKICLPIWFGVGVGSIFDMLGAITRYNFPITGARVRKFCTSTHHTAKKIREEGFVPPVGLEEGFARTLAWIRSNNLL